MRPHERVCPSAAVASSTTFTVAAGARRRSCPEPAAAEAGHVVRPVQKLPGRGVVSSTARPVCSVGHLQLLMLLVASPQRLQALSVAPFQSR